MKTKTRRDLPVPIKEKKKQLPATLADGRKRISKLKNVAKMKSIMGDSAEDIQQLLETGDNDSATAMIHKRILQTLVDTSLPFADARDLIKEVTNLTLDRDPRSAEERLLLLRLSTYIVDFMAVLNNYEFYCYVLLDTRKPGRFSYGRFTFPYEPFYVGKGKGARSSEHVASALRSNKNTPKLSKIRSILRNGHQVEVLQTKHLATELESFALERELVSVIGRGKDGPLTNLTDGGDGTAGYKFTSAQKRRVRKAVNSIPLELKQEQYARRQATKDARSPSEVAASSESMRAAAAARSAEAESRRIARIQRTNRRKSPEEKAAINARRLETFASKTPEEKAATAAKFKDSMAAKSIAEIDEWKSNLRAAKAKGRSAEEVKKRKDTVQRKREERQRARGLQ